MRRAEKVETEQVYLMQLAALTLKNVVGEGGECFSMFKCLGGWNGSKKHIPVN